MVATPQELYDQDKDEEYQQDRERMRGGRREPDASLEPAPSPADPVHADWLIFELHEGDRFDDPDRGAKIAKWKARPVRPTLDLAGCETWHDDSNPNLIALRCPKIVGKCEDSPPVLIAPSGRPDAPAFVGVFDGMGGAGAGQVQLDSSNPSAFTEALIASYTCRRAVEEQVFVSDLQNRDALVEEIKSRFEKAQVGTSLKEGSRIRGTLTKRLPTTLVVSRLEPVPARNISKITTWWAGDSRAFLVTPEDGLAAATRDHVRESDQLEQLRTDPPLENVVNHSTNFYLDETRWELPGPFVLLLATDGVFGYLPTPGFLELGFLDALTSGYPNIASKFADFCSRYAADDVSAVMVVSGFRNDQDLADRFRDRLAILRDRYSRICTMTSDDPNWNVEVERLWSLERPTYQRLVGA